MVSKEISDKMLKNKDTFFEVADEDNHYYLVRCDHTRLPITLPEQTTVTVLAITRFVPNIN